MKKRILSLLLTLVMILGMIPATTLTAFAESGEEAESGKAIVGIEGLGTPDNPYLIVNRAQWTILFGDYDSSKSGSGFDGQYVKLCTDIATDDIEFQAQIFEDTHLDLNVRTSEGITARGEGCVVEVTGSGAAPFSSRLGATLILNDTVDFDSIGLQLGTSILNSSSAEGYVTIRTVNSGKSTLILKQGTVTDLRINSFDAFGDADVFMYGGRLEDEFFRDTDYAEAARINFAFYGGVIAPDEVSQDKDKYYDVEEVEYIVTNTSYAFSKDGTTKKIASYDDLVDAIVSYGEFAVYAPCFVEQSIEFSDGVADLGTIQASSYPITFKGNKVPVSAYADGYRAYETLKVYDSNKKLVDECSNDTQNGEGLTYDLNRLPQGTYTIVEEVTFVDKNGQELLSEENKIVVNWKPIINLGFASQNPKMPGESTTAARETLRLGASKTYSFTAEALSANSPYSLMTGIVIYNETENKTVYSSAGNELSRSIDVSDYITETGKYYVMEEIVLYQNGERIDALRHIFPFTVVKEALPSVAANVTVPVFEGTPSDAVLSSDSQSDCTITKTEWYKRDTFGNETKIDSTHSFEVNGRYRCYVTFAPVAGTYFSSATAVYINGEKATLSGSIGDTATYYVTYDIDTDNLPVLLTDDSFPKTGSSMTVDIDAMAELSEDIMEAYFNGEISVEWYVDGTRVESAPTSDFGEKLEVKAEYNGKEVYAKFIYGSKSLTGKTYTITGEVCTIGFDANGGSNASAHSAVALTKGSAYTLPECKFTAPTGYVFKAWEVNGVEYAPGAQIMVNDNVTAVAVWEDATVTHTVTFKVDTTTVATKTVENGKTVTAPADPTQSGKTFLGWYTDGGTKFDFTTPITGDITLTAKFEDVVSGESYIVGDVNGDNEVNIMDATILLRYINGWSGYDQYIKNMDAADVSRDGNVLINDATILLRYANNWSGYDQYIFTVNP